MKIVFAIAICFGSVSSASADTLTEEEAVEAGADSLDGSINYPWYDAKSDGIRRIDVEPPSDLQNRQSDWLRKPKEKKKKKKKGNVAWGTVLWNVMRGIGWTAVVIAFVAVGYLLVRAFLMAETSSASTTSSNQSEKEDARSDVDRVESLPFQLSEPQGDLLSQARQEYEAGNYANAIIYLYSYQLVELDKHQLIRLTKGKTNRQYLREVRSRSNLSGLLQQTMLMFEDVFFGNHELERRRFESCWTTLDEFHQGLEQAVA